MTVPSQRDPRRSLILCKISSGGPYLLLLLLLPVLPLLRETVIADPPGVQTFATLVPLPVAAMGPPTPSPELGISSSRPSLVLTREGGGSTLAALEASSSGSAPLIVPPPIPRKIWYAGAGVL